MAFSFQRPYSKYQTKELSSLSLSSSKCLFLSPFQCVCVHFAEEIGIADVCQRIVFLFFLICDQLTVGGNDAAKSRDF